MVTEASPLGAALFIGGAVGAAVIAAGVVNFVWSRERRSAYNEVAGQFFAAVGAFYAILLALVVVSVWENLEDAELTTYTEANALPGIYYSSTAFSDAERADLQEIMVTYTRRVILDEWPTLAGGRSAPSVEEVAGRMRKAVLMLEPKTPKQEALYSAMIERINTINSSRRDRLNESHPSIPGYLWVGLSIGAVLVTGFALSFGTPHALPHVLMVAVLALIVSASLYYIQLMDHPFRGTFKIEPDAYRIALVQMKQTPP